MTKKVKLASLKVNLDEEREGAWVSSSTYPGVQYRLRSSNEPKHAAENRKQIRAYAESVRDGKDPSDEEMQKLDAERVCKFLLIDWSGFDEAFSPESALSILKDHAYREVLNDIMAAAARVGRQKMEFIEEDSKN